MQLSFYTNKERQVERTKGLVHHQHFCSKFHPFECIFFRARSMFLSGISQIPD